MDKRTCEIYENLNLLTPLQYIPIYDYTSLILCVYNYPFKDGNSDCGIQDITTDTVRGL